MTWSHLFKPAAKRDFDAAFDWHEQQETGRGDLFAAEVARAVALICRRPICIRRFIAMFAQSDFACIPTAFFIAFVL